MRISRILPVVGIVFSIFCFTTGSAYSQDVPLKVAVVNFQKVMAVAAAPKGIREQVKTIRDKYREEVQKEDAALQTAQQALAQKQAILSPDAFKEERRKFDQQLRDVQKRVQQKKLNLQKAQNEALEKVNSALRDVILAYSAEQGYTLVLRRVNTVVVADKYDISDAIIKRLNEKVPSVKVFK
ncbi:OmpH family outer membrane protein [Terasakiella sp. A23]|uniref:OmpH family outer membrane protein n=1 Tax=Terasakiella sp. FCG-A23 TaxID=3080561 RepID=UPI0029535511|nr:OmpH family outer membrane protein [Terasakiella sp. A23]MDV7338869.1 OmpH family outer membrane protein [Terasakiella sp. A23]